MSEKDQAAARPQNSGQLGNRLAQRTAVRESKRAHQDVDALVVDGQAVVRVSPRTGRQLPNGAAARGGAGTGWERVDWAVGEQTFVMWDLKHGREAPFRV